MIGTLMIKSQEAQRGLGQVILDGVAGAIRERQVHSRG